MAIVSGSENEGKAAADRAPDVIQEKAPHGVFALVLLSLVAVASLVVVPSLPAESRGLTHFTSMGSVREGPWDGGHLGVVTVVNCSRGRLVLDWTCRGLFQVNDPMSDDYPPVQNVTVVNDARFHSAGSMVGAKLTSGYHQAYLWGGLEQLKLLAFWAGLLLCMMAGLVIVPRHLRRVRALSLVPLLLGIGILTAVQPLW
jgi:hypothetical protein